MARKSAAPKKPVRKKTTSSRRSAGNKAGAGGGRAVWTGQLRLALVAVPVLLFPAVKKGARLSFHQVHKPSGKRIRYEKVVPGIGPVELDEIFKAYEISKGQYVMLTDKDFDAVKIEARKTLDLVQFVDYCEIDPIYFDSPYYVVPDGELAEDAYRVLRDALRASKKMGIGQFVMRGREYVAALKPCGDGLLIETLRFADEVREASPLFADISKQKPDAELLDLAKELISRKSAAFDPDKFRDDYTEALRSLIDKRSRSSKPLKVEEEEPSSEGAQIIDLVEALKRSVKGGKAPAAASTKRKGHRKASR